MSIDLPVPLNNAAVEIADYFTIQCDRPDANAWAIDWVRERLAEALELSDADLAMLRRAKAVRDHTHKLTFYDGSQVEDYILTGELP